MLRDQGIEVEVGLLRDRAFRLNERFIKYILTKQPFVTLKSASTLDGNLATKSGDSKWISNGEAREIVHTLRHRHQGIMVGVNTVIADNPSLTTRTEVPGINPTRIIIDSGLRIPLDSAVVCDGLAPTLIVTTDAADPAKKAALLKAGVQIVVCGAGPRVDLKAFHDIPWRNGNWLYFA